LKQGAIFGRNDEGSIKKLIFAKKSKGPKVSGAIDLTRRKTPVSLALRPLPRVATGEVLMPEGHGKKQL